MKNALCAGTAGMTNHALRDVVTLCDLQCNLAATANLASSPHTVLTPSIFVPYSKRTVMYVWGEKSLEVEPLRAHSSGYF